MKNKGIDWFFWGPAFGVIFVFIVSLFTIAEKVSEGVFRAEQSTFSFFLAGLLLDCYIVLVYGRLKDDFRKRIKKQSLLLLLIITPWLTEGLYFIIQ